MSSPSSSAQQARQALGLRLVNRATIGGARSIAALLSDAFHDDPVSTWLIPDLAERRRRHMRLFLAFVEHALLDGEVQL